MCQPIEWCVILAYTTRKPTWRLAEIWRETFCGLRPDRIVVAEYECSYNMMIVGHARDMGLILVTNNIEEVKRAPGLRVENWA